MQSVKGRRFYISVFKEKGRNRKVAKSWKLEREWLGVDK